jgi:hypothetical protein
MATSGCSEDDGCVDPEHDHSENRKRAVEFFDGLREAGHDLDGVFDDEEDEAAIYGVLTALLDDVSRDALERMREIVALLTFEPTGDEDVTACAKCHSMVTVRDGSEWEDGDICDSCAHDVLDAVRARALASLGGGR